MLAGVAVEVFPAEYSWPTSTRKVRMEIPRILAINSILGYLSEYPGTRPTAGYPLVPGTVSTLFGPVKLATNRGFVTQQVTGTTFDRIVTMVIK